MDAPTDLRALLYARVSSQAQAQRAHSQHKEASLDEQLAAMRREAVRRRWHVVEELRDVIPGAVPVSQRPAGSRIYHHLDADDFDLLVVYDNDRIGRDQDAVVAKVFRADLRRAGKQVFSVYQPIEPKAPTEYAPYDDDAALWLESVTDTASSVAIRQFRRRSAFGMRKRVETKKLMAGRCPTGYTAERHLLPNGKTILGKRSPDPIYAPVVKRIFDEYELGRSFKNIARLLNVEGIRPPRGDLWTYATIDNILDNPVYYGAACYYKYRSTGRPNPKKPGSRLRKRQPRETWLVAEGAEHEPIITKAQWLRCQEIRRSRRDQGRLYGESHLLAGLGKCGFCGRGMYRSGGSRSRKGDSYLWCSRYVLTRGRECHRNSVGRMHLEEEVVRFLSDLANDPKWRARLSVQHTEDALKRLQEECRNARAQLTPFSDRYTRMREAYEAGVDTLEEYRHRKQELDHEQKTIRERLAANEARLKQASETVHQLETLDELLSEFSRKFEQKPLRIQKLLIRLLISEVRVKDKQVEIIFRDGAPSGSEYDEILKIIHAYSEEDEPDISDAKPDRGSSASTP